MRIRASTMHAARAHTFSRDGALQHLRVQARGKALAHDVKAWHCVVWSARLGFCVPKGVCVRARKCACTHASTRARACTCKPQRQYPAQRCHMCAVRCAVRYVAGTPHACMHANARMDACMHPSTHPTHPPECCAARLRRTCRGVGQPPQHRLQWQHPPRPASCPLSAPGGGPQGQGAVAGRSRSCCTCCCWWPCCILRHRTGSAASCRPALSGALRPSKALNTSGGLAPQFTKELQLHAALYQLVKYGLSSTANPAATPPSSDDAVLVRTRWPTWVVCGVALCTIRMVFRLQ